MPIMKRILVSRLFISFRFSFPDAMVTEDVVEDDFGVQEVCTKDGIDGRQGTAEVFGHQVGRNAAGEGSAAILQGGRGLAKGVIVPDIGHESGILIGNEVFFQC